MRNYLSSEGGVPNAELFEFGMRSAEFGITWVRNAKCQMRNYLSSEFEMSNAELFEFGMRSAKCGIIINLGTANAKFGSFFISQLALRLSHSLHSAFRVFFTPPSAFSSFRIWHSAFRI